MIRITGDPDLEERDAQELRQRGIERIAIVAHSMGGLVSREMLTSPEMNYQAAEKNGQVPEVVALIMVGTPNHGSQLARFRVFAEWRDHLARLTKGEGYWLGSILDGAGEAKIDLLPGSLFRFLRGAETERHQQRACFSGHLLLVLLLY